MLCRGVTDFVQGSSPFLRLPAEIRTEIYHDLIDQSGQLEEQPAIARVNRQLRAEVLPLFYDETSAILVNRKSSQDWVTHIQRIVDAFTGSADSLPGSSNLRLLHDIQVNFTTPYGTHIEVELVEEPGDMTPQTPDDPDRPVIVGSPGLDWTDAAAARAACDEAATLLAERLRARPRTDNRGLVLVQTSDESDHRAALDCARILALACPQLTTVRIYDSSRAHKVEASILRFMSYENIRERLFTDVEV